MRNASKIQKISVRIRCRIFSFFFHHSFFANNFSAILKLFTLKNKEIELFYTFQNFGGYRRLKNYVKGRNDEGLNDKGKTRREIYDNGMN